MKNTFFLRRLSLLCPVVLACLIFLILYNVVTAQQARAADGRKISREAQLSLVEANRRYTTQPEDLRAARQPLLDYLAAGPAEVVPLVMYQMLGQLWYTDDKAANRLVESQKVFAAGHAAYPGDENLLRNYAVTTYELGQLGKAARLFEQYYETSKEHNIKYLSYAASAFYADANLVESKRVFLRMISLVETPESKWLESVITICMEQKAPKEALNYIERALNHYPMEKKYWNLMANLYLEQSEYRRAAGAFEIGSRVEAPHIASEWKNLIDLYNYLNLPLRSAKIIQRGATAGWDTNEPRITAADAFARGMRVDEAVAFIDAAPPSEMNLQLLLKKGRILFDARRNPSAIAVLDKCLTMDPKAWEAYILKGWAAWDLKDWKTAKKAFTQALNSRQYKAQAQNALEMLHSLDEARSK